MKKRDEEIEMLATAPREALSEEQIRAEREERIQTIERALCGMLDRLDVIEKEHTSVDPQGSGAVGREHETIRALIDIMDERVTAIEKRHEQKDQLHKWHDDNKPKFTIWESLEHKGLAERWEGTLVLTTKGRQVASLFDNGEIEDIRE